MCKGHIVLQVLSTLIIVGQAQLLHPLEHVVGSWNVNLSQRSEKLFNSIVFPPQSCSALLNEQSIQTTVRPRGRRRRALNCELILEPNGKFILNPPSNSENIFERNDGVISKASRLPLKGYWKLKPNPYCVTDRQYDELLLVSNPKTRFNENENDGGSRYHKERVILEMQCKVWGRFGSNTIRSLMKLPRARDAGRLSHGTVSIRKDELVYENSTSKSQLQTSRRVVCATFNAKTTNGNKTKVELQK